MTAGAARAQDDDEDDKTFEEKIIDGIMAGIGGTNMENRGIEYRERSPLVVPPKLDLPPPEVVSKRDQGSELAEGSGRGAAQGRDRGPQESKTRILANSSRLLTPSELNVGRTAAPARTNNDPMQPGVIQQPDAQPVAARLQRRPQRPFRRQQGRDVGPVQGRADAGIPDRASGRIPDAVAEFRLRHRTARNR